MSKAKFSETLVGNVRTLIVKPLFRYIWTVISELTIMSRLNELYKSVEFLKKEGLSFEDKEQELFELEESIIKYPNGDVIQEKTAKDTLIEFIRRTGYKKVRELALENKSKNLRAGGGILISNTLDSKYRSEQHEIAPGWYVCTHGATIHKKRSTETISE